MKKLKEEIMYVVYDHEGSYLYVAYDYQTCVAWANDMMPEYWGGWEGWLYIGKVRVSPIQEDGGPYDPLQSLVGTNDYSKGYDAGKYYRENKLKREILTKYGIKSGSTLLNERFSDEDSARQRIVELCGTKIDPENSTFKVVKV
jgi:hypothetical protein